MNNQEDRMVITADQAREIATEQERSDRRTLNEKVERETLALTTTWLGRRRLRYVERAIWRAARRGERETLVGGWSYARAHGVARYLRLHGFMTSVDSLTLGGRLVVLVRW